MKLSDLITTAPITIQCHDNPDADALGAGYALYTYLRLKGVTLDSSTVVIFKFKKQILWL